MSLVVQLDAMLAMPYPISIYKSHLHLHLHLPLYYYIFFGTASSPSVDQFSYNLNPDLT